MFKLYDEDVLYHVNDYGEALKAYENGVMEYERLKT